MVHSYVHPTPARGRCRIRLYLPEDETGEDAPVIVCTEPADNPGQSITNSAEQLCAEVLKGHNLKPPVIWIENYEDEARGTKEDPHTFDLVSFEHFEPREAFGPDGWHVRIGDSSWKPLERATVETLIGGELA